MIRKIQGKKLSKKTNYKQNFKKFIDSGYTNIDAFNTPSNSTVTANNNDVNNNINNNSFWIPVSDEKMETSSFPNINIPINDGLSSNDNFGFPELNNN